MNEKYFMIIVFLIIPIHSFTQSWMQKNPLFNYGRYCAIGCEVNGKGYAGMGQNKNGTYLDDFWEYNPAANQWKRKSDFPAIGRYGASAFSIKGRIYVCFGYDDLRVCRNDMWEYNPQNDSWTEKAALPAQARYSASGFVIGDSVLYIGTGTYGNFNDYLYDFWMYSPAKDRWTKKSDFPGGKRQDAASFSINGMGYLGSGLSSYMNPTRDFWKYNPGTDSWSAIQPLPYDEATLVSVTIRDKGYVGGGINYSTFSTSNNFLEYNPDTDTWTPLKPQDNAMPRHAGIGFTIGDVAYFGTGYNDDNFFSDIWALDTNGYGNEEQCEDCICETDFELYLYPNPATNKVVLEIKKGYKFKNVLVNVYNSLGQFTISHITQSDKTEININELEPGLYMARIFVDSKVSVKRFIKM